MNKNIEIVPFGKYRGQPVTVLQHDQEYVDWLIQQPWIGERYPSLRTLIVNHFGEPTETPAHNALQLLFLDEALCRQACQAWIHFLSKPGQNFGGISQVSFEKDGIDVTIYYATWEWIPGSRSVVNGQWEPGHWFHSVPPYVNHLPLRLELKPSLGDDYPACLRKMLARDGASILVYEAWASSMPVEQVQQLFAQSERLLCSLATLRTYPAAPCVDVPLTPPGDAPQEGETLCAPENGHSYASTRGWLEKSTYAPFLSRATEESRP